MNKSVAIGGLVVIAIVLVAAGYVLQTGTNTTSSTTTTATTTESGSSTSLTQTGTSTSQGSSTTATSSVSTGTSTTGSSSLQLRLSVNATNVLPLNTVQISVSEYNTGAAVSNVSVANLWKVNDLSLGPCGRTIYPFGVAVFRGWYTEENASLGQPLQVYRNVPCPLLIRLVTGYLFQPSSDLAVVLPGTGAVPTAMAANVTVVETYSGSSNLPFVPGTYTVVAGDEWGALAVLHFVVTQASTSSTQTTTTGTVNGTLAVHFSIGPTAPVCRVNSTVTSATSPYTSINAVITSSSGHNTTLPVAWLSDGCSVSGSFSASLAPGTYSLSLSSCPFMGCGSSLPRSFEIVSSQTTGLDISIDTGIR